jgi:hypothetical protein
VSVIGGVYADVTDQDVAPGSGRANGGSVVVGATVVLVEEVLVEEVLVEEVLVDDVLVDEVVVVVVSMVLVVGELVVELVGGAIVATESSPPRFASHTMSPIARIATATATNASSARGGPDPSGAATGVLSSPFTGRPGTGRPGPGTPGSGRFSSVGSFIETSSRAQYPGTDDTGLHPSACDFSFRIPSPVA